MRCNKKELAGILGVTERALTLWQDEGMPIAKKGRRGVSNEYDTGTVIDWRVQREVSKATGETPKDRLARVQADRVELDIAEKLGRLVPVDSIEPMWLGYVTSARQFLRAEPPRLAHVLELTEGVEAKRAKLEQTFDEYLNKLSGLGADIEDDLDDAHEAGDAEDGPPAKTKRRRVGGKV